MCVLCGCVCSWVCRGSLLLLLVFLSIFKELPCTLVQKTLHSSHSGIINGSSLSSMLWGGKGFVCMFVCGGWGGLEVEQSQLTNLVVFKHRHDEGRMWFTMMKPREMLCMQLQINV